LLTREKEDVVLHLPKTQTAFAQMAAILVSDIARLGQVSTEKPQTSLATATP
jgi:hypothetical protein